MRTHRDVDCLLVGTPRCRVRSAQRADPTFEGQTSLTQKTFLRGFTLVELVISAAIGSMILIGSYACLNAGLSSQKLIEPRVAVLQSARVAVAMMTSDLRSACSLSPDFDFVGEHRTLELMRADNLDFATHHYTPSHAGEGDYCEVSYYVDKNLKAQQFSLWRRRNPRLAPEPLVGGSREEIVRGLRGLKLEYYDGLDWYDSWGNAHPDKTQKNSSVVAANVSGYPEAVRITLFLEPNPHAIAPDAEPDSKPEPPLIFQTVVHLELADVPAPAAGGTTGGTTNNTTTTPNGNGPPQGGTQ